LRPFSRNAMRLQPTLACVCETSRFSCWIPKISFPLMFVWAVLSNSCSDCLLLPSFPSFPSFFFSFLPSLLSFPPFLPSFFPFLPSLHILLPSLLRVSRLYGPRAGCTVLKYFFENKSPLPLLSWFLGFFLKKEGLRLSLSSLSSPLLLSFSLFFSSLLFSQQSVVS